MYIYHNSNLNLKLVFFILVAVFLILTAGKLSLELKKEQVVQINPKYMKFNSTQECTVSFGKSLRRGQRVRLINVTHESPNVMTKYKTSVGTFYAEIFNDDIECKEIENVQLP